MTLDSIKHVGMTLEIYSIYIYLVILYTHLY